MNILIVRKRVRPECVWGIKSEDNASACVRCDEWGVQMCGVLVRGGINGEIRVAAC